jgi:hypothetical protein
MSIPESHLAQEAIAALVDGELPAGPAGRAARHLSGCLQCRLAVEAQREAKEALHGSRDVAVPGDLMSRLCAIPFTTDVPGPGGGLGNVAAGPTGLTVSDGTGAWSVDLQPQERAQRPGHARWLRRGVTGTMIGLGVGVTVLALNLPASAPATERGNSVADRPGAEQHTEVVPPVVRTVTVGTNATGGTP